MQQAYTRLMEPLQNMVNVLSTDKPRIFESLVGNVREVIAEIPGLNLTDDIALAKFAREAEVMLTSITPEMLRDDKVLRQDTVDKAKAIITTFGVVGKRRFAPENTTEAA